MSKDMTWEEYADELKAELAKLKQQLAIAVKSLSTITNCAPACFRTEECPLEGGYGFNNGCFRCGYATAFEALQKIKELENKNKIFTYMGKPIDALTYIEKKIEYERKELEK